MKRNYTSELGYEPCQITFAMFFESLDSDVDDAQAETTRQNISAVNFPLGSRIDDIADDIADSISDSLGDVEYTRIGICIDCGTIVLLCDTDEAICPHCEYGEVMYFNDIKNLAAHLLSAGEVGRTLDIVMIDETQYADLMFA